MHLQKFTLPVWGVQIKLKDLATFTAELDSTPVLNPTEVVLGCSVNRWVALNFVDLL